MIPIRLGHERRVIKVQTVAREYLTCNLINERKSSIWCSP